MRAGTTFLLLGCGILSVAAACNSRPDELIGRAGSALIAQGQACSAASECATGFCVDGVCCNTACGGTLQQPCGVSDEFSCSNLYGNVGGLTDGTCVTLTTGQACGELVNCSPCQARGAKLTNGTQCPNPVLFSRNGLVCRASTSACDPQEVCTSNACPSDVDNCTDAGADASAADTGVDSAADSGDLDSSVDSGDLDSSVDSGDLDSSVDSGEFDSSVDSSDLDSSVDSGGGDADLTDGGADAGTPDAASSDSGADAGPADSGVAEGGSDSGRDAATDSSDDGAADGSDARTVEGGGCACSTTGSSSSGNLPLALLMGLTVVSVLRRRRR